MERHYPPTDILLVESSAIPLPTSTLVEIPLPTEAIRIPLYLITHQWNPKSHYPRMELPLPAHGMQWSPTTHWR